MRTLVFIACAFCFGSFAWAMVWHFRRGADRSAATVAVAVVAIASALLHIFAVATRPLHLAWTATGMYAALLRYTAGAALLLYAASAALFWWAVSVTRAIRPAACFQKTAPTTLTTRGPYAMVRHPFYAAYDLTWAAGFAATLWWPVAVSALIMMCVYHAAALAEERAFSRSSLAAEHRDYARRTGFYLPRFPTPSVPDKAD